MSGMGRKQTFAARLNEGPLPGAFENDILVTRGHEWGTSFIPIEVNEVEALRREPSFYQPNDLVEALR
jgi:hypothetical protein